MVDIIPMTLLYSKVTSYYKETINRVRFRLCEQFSGWIGCESFLSFLSVPNLVPPWCLICVTAYISYSLCTYFCSKVVLRGTWSFSHSSLTLFSVTSAHIFYTRIPCDLEYLCADPLLAPKGNHLRSGDICVARFALYSYTINSTNSH